MITSVFFLFRYNTHSIQYISLCRNTKFCHLVGVLWKYKLTHTLCLFVRTFICHTCQLHNHEYVYGTESFACKQSVNTLPGVSLFFLPLPVSFSFFLSLCLFYMAHKCVLLFLRNFLLNRDFPLRYINTYIRAVWLCRVRSRGRLSDVSLFASNVCGVKKL